MAQLSFNKITERFRRREPEPPQQRSKGQPKGLSFLNPSLTSQLDPVYIFLLCFFSPTSPPHLNPSAPIIAELNKLPKYAFTMYGFHFLNNWVI